MMTINHQYYCPSCGYKRQGLLNAPAVGIGSWSTICPECGTHYKSYEECSHVNVEKTEHLTGDGAMEYVKWFDNTCLDCGKKWTANV